MSALPSKTTLLAVGLLGLATLALVNPPPAVPAATSPCRHRAERGPVPGDVVLRVACAERQGYEVAVETTPAATRIVVNGQMMPLDPGRPTVITRARGGDDRAYQVSLDDRSLADAKLRFTVRPLR